MQLLAPPMLASLGTVEKKSERKKEWKAGRVLYSNLDKFVMQIEVTLFALSLKS